MEYVVIAQKEELKLVEELGYGSYPIIITGVGGLNVIRALKDLQPNAGILNIGYCGSNTIPVGTKVVVEEVATLHENAQFNEPKLRLYKTLLKDYNTSCDCYTSTDFVTKTDIKEPCVFDMELAFIRAMFYDVTAIKVVSDNLNKDQYDKNIIEGT